MGKGFGKIAGFVSSCFAWARKTKNVPAGGQDNASDTGKLTGKGGGGIEADQIVTVKEIPVEAHEDKSILIVKINKPTLGAIFKAMSNGSKSSFKSGILTGSVRDGKIVVEGVLVLNSKTTKTGTVISKEEQARAFAVAKAAGKRVIGYASFVGLGGVSESQQVKKARAALAKYGALNLALVMNGRGRYQLHFDPLVPNGKAA
jgi:hypothetical protein